MTMSAGEPVNCSVSPAFHEWMSGIGGSIALTTYQAGRVALIGFDGGRVTPLLRPFDTPMGLAVAGQTLAMATRSEITLFANAPSLAPHYPTREPAGYDALYLPRTRYCTGDLKVHDVAFGSEELLFVNTLFSCLCTAGAQFSFDPRWKPPFISRIAAEDRCHLNGVAMVDGRPRFVSALGQSDSPGGWRPDKVRGGVLLDVETGETILSGLCMPHSPRWHEGRLWLLNSGTGELCQVDRQSRRCIPIVGLPGFLRGLGFAGRFALAGMCQIRQSNLFGGLPVKEKFPSLQCGIAVVDLRSGTHVATFEFTSGIHEVFEVQFLPGVLRPMIIGPDSPDARRAITSPALACWFSGEAE
jgi:uncharacterized protein (TIGR03032 family)